MTFRLAVSPSYKVEVTVHFPGEDGKLKKQSFVAIFKRLPQGEIELLRDRIAARAKDLRLETDPQPITDRELLDSVLIGWEAVQDEDGNDLPFNEANKNSLLSIHPTQPRLVTAFLNSLTQAREKN
jgi:hypothetical protein